MLRNGVESGSCQSGSDYASYDVGKLMTMHICTAEVSKIAEWAVEALPCNECWSDRSRVARVDSVPDVLYKEV
jgi:hypothetical protein